jgi:hypothetical protein
MCGISLEGLRRFVDSTKKDCRIQACNDYAIVIQEYFQFRVQEFMDNIGKEVFSIHYYWLRYEFAKSRGHIHAHLLYLEISKISKM